MTTFRKNKKKNPRQAVRYDQIHAKQGHTRHAPMTHKLDTNDDKVNVRPVLKKGGLMRGGRTTEQDVAT